MSNSEPIIEVKNLSKSYGKKKVIENISFKVFEHELLVIVGLSGTGKSTLLKLICGLEEPDSGEIILNTSKINMVFQGAALFDSMSVFDNVAFPITSNEKNINKDELKRVVQEKLKLVGLNGIENLMPDQLSGGMKKRVSFARAVVNHPKVVLYDEPTSGLDPILSTIIMEYIVKLKDELNVTSVLVTHHMKEISQVDGRVILLYDSKAAWEGSTKEFFQTDSPIVKQFREAKPQGPMVVIKE